ncbi:MAG: hypothetical protein QM756_08085 [Polyangiaceae bacterium]
MFGWAAVEGLGAKTTSGGGNAAPLVVENVEAFRAAVAGDAPAVVHVKGVLAAASVNVGSNKTVVGLAGARFNGHLGVGPAHNVIVQNLTLVGYGVGDCSKDPSFKPEVGCSSGSDAISITKGAHHVWIDHCDISDGTDGNLDINAGADFVTVSWTKFHYSPRRDDVGDDSTGARGHRFSNLIGSRDGLPEDVGHLNVTWHHNWWADNVSERMPRTRNGKIHVLNNLFTASGNVYCTNAGNRASLLVEGNVYMGVKDPLVPMPDGDMLARDNAFESTSGAQSASGVGFTPPYAYAVDATRTLASMIRVGVGPH